MVGLLAACCMISFLERSRERKFVCIVYSYVCINAVGEKDRERHKFISQETCDDNVCFPGHVSFKPLLQERFEPPSTNFS